MQRTRTLCSRICLCTRACARTLRLREGMQATKVCDTACDMIQPTKVLCLNPLRPALRDAAARPACTALSTACARACHLNPDQGPTIVPMMPVHHAALCVQGHKALPALHVLLMPGCSSTAACMVFFTQPCTAVQVFCRCFAYRMEAAKPRRLRLGSATDAALMSIFFSATECAATVLASSKMLGMDGSSSMAPAYSRTVPHPAPCKTVRCMPVQGWA